MNHPLWAARGSSVCGFQEWCVAVWLYVSAMLKVGDVACGSVASFRISVGGGFFHPPLVNSFARTFFFNRDFVKTNKYAAVSGCVTSKHNATFRRQNDLRLSKGTFKVRSSTVPDPNMVYGRANPRPASIDAILNNSFQRQWISEQRAIEQSQSARSARRSFRPSQHTRASLG